jgi:hypothetical protein
MGAFGADAVSKATVSAVITRACARCGGARAPGVPCAGCGNPEPAQAHDLGVQSAYYRNPFRRLAWLAIGQHRAARRARAASTQTTGGCR